MKLIHHGNCKGEFTPFFIGTDYFAFKHKPCDDSNHTGFSEITAVLIDNKGRIIFNLKCTHCGKTDALKTSRKIWNLKKPPENTEYIYLSPNLKNQIKTHKWDNL